MKTTLNVNNNKAKLPNDLIEVIEVCCNGLQIPSINIEHLPTAQFNYWEKDIPQWAIRDDYIYFSSKILNKWEKFKSLFKLSKADEFTIKYISENEYKFWNSSQEELYDAVRIGVLKVSEMLFIMENRN